MGDSRGTLVTLLVLLNPLWVSAEDTVYVLSDSPPTVYRPILEKKGLHQATEEYPAIPTTPLGVIAASSRVHPVRLDPVSEERLKAMYLPTPVFKLLGDDGSSAPATVAEASTGITVTVNPDGTYVITAQDPAWTFGGDIGQPLSNIAVTTGQDGIGTYQKITFDYSMDGGPRESSIRTYAGRAIVMFSTTFAKGGNNADIFPHLSTYPQGLES